MLSCLGWSRESQSDIGGGVIVVPVLVPDFGFDLKTAKGTSLFAIMWRVGILGVPEYDRRGELQVVPGALIAAGMLFGTLAGARMLAGISQANMQRLYAVFLIVVGSWMVVRPYIMTRPEVGARGAAPEGSGGTKAGS